MKLNDTAIAKLRDTLLAKGRRPTMVLSAAYETLARQGMLGPEESAALQWVDPVAEAMFLTIAADGVVAQPEQDLVRGAIRILTDGEIRSGTIAVMLEQYEARLETEGREARLAALAEALAEEPPVAEAAFLLAAASALADDRVEGGERAVVKELAERLGIPPGRRDTILNELDRLSRP